MSAKLPFKRVKLNLSDIPGGTLRFPDPAANTAEDLKLCLQCRGIRCSNKNKKELVKLTESALEENLSISSGRNVRTALSREAAVLRAIDVNAVNIIDIFPVSGWKPFPSRPIPRNFSIAGIYKFLKQTAIVIDSDSEGENLGTDFGTDKSLVRGRQYFRSEYVQDILDATSASSHFCMKSQVHASMRSTNHLVLIMLNINTSDVIDASCDCKASALQRCSHVAALLFTLEDYTSQFGYHPTPCTSQLCSWNQGAAGKNSQPVYSNKNSNKRVPSRAIDFNPSSQPQSTHVNVVNILSACLKVGAFPTITKWQHLLDYDYTDYNITNERRIVLSLQIRDFLESLKFGHNAPGEVPGTALQSESPRWASLRQIIITASVIKSFMNVSHEKRYALIKQHMWYPIPFTSIYTDHGKNNEEKARQAYTSLTKNIVKTTGMWVNPRYPGLAASPDALVFCHATKSCGVLEIKCPFRLRNLHPKDFEQLGNKAKDLCLKKEGERIFLKKNHEYYKQIIMQMAMVGVECCDFVVYSTKGIWLERIPFDSQLWEEMASSLMKFHHNYMCPEYFEMRTVRKLQPIEMEEVTTSTQFCLQSDLPHAVGA